MTPQDPAALAAARILVVAPHPDDESLGCGGLVASLCRLGRQFHFLFVTDGAASHRGSPSWPRIRLAAQRRIEAADALRLLGADEQPRTFLSLPDAAMPPPGSDAYERALATVAEIARTFRPDLVLLPWRRDPHCDHRDSWRLAVDGLERADIRAATLEYAVWLDEFGAVGDAPRPGEAAPVVFDIGPAMPAKRAAIAAHRSQTTDLIDDAAEAFRLSAETIDRLCGPCEIYWTNGA